jgi:hypothetical protein
LTEEAFAMQPTQVKKIRETIDAAQRFAHATSLSGCDASDIDEICEALHNELKRPLPSAQALAMYMNSLVTSLRPQHHGAQIAAELHEAMSDAGIRIDP